MDSKGLKERSKRSFAWDLLGSMVRQLASFGISITLARLLAPEEFGVIGMAMVFVSISQVFINVGFTEGLIQKKDVSDTAYSSVFYLNLAISFVLAVLIYFTAPLIGSFFESQTVAEILRYLAVIPPLGALGRVHAAILAKNIDFKALAIRDIVATLIGGTIGIIAALQGFGVYSLVWQQISSTLAGTIMLWVGTGWKPKRIFSSGEIKELFLFSSFVFFDKVLQQVFNKIDTLFIGKVFSPAILGFYTRAESLNSQIKDYTSNSLRKVIFPVFSALQDDDKRFESVYNKAFSLATVISIILAGSLFFLAEEIIITLLGDKWAPSIPVFKILVFVTIISPHIGLMSKAILGKGYSTLKFKLGLIERMINLLPIAFGLFWGFMPFVAGVTISRFLVFLLFTAALQKVLNISFATQIKEFLIPLVPLIVSIWGFEAFFPETNPWIKLLVYLSLQVLFLIAVQHSSLNVARPFLKKWKQRYLIRTH